MPFDSGTKRYVRPYAFVDQFDAGEEALRSDFDAVHNDLVTGVNDAIEYLEGLGAYQPLYLGAYTTAGRPTTQQDATALEAGNFYFDTDLVAFQVWDGDSWENVTGYASPNAWLVTNFFPSSSAAQARASLELGSAATADTSAFLTTSALTAALKNYLNATITVTATGAGGVFNIAAPSTITAYEDGQIFSFYANHSSGVANKVNVDGLGELFLRQRSLGTGELGVSNYDIAEDDLVIFEIRSGAAVVRNIHVGGSATTTRRGPVRLGTLQNLKDAAQFYTPDCQAVNSFVTGYVSAAQTITSGGELVLSHGLGAEPNKVTFVLQCVTAENGFSIGNRLYVDPASASGTSARFNAVRLSATEITIRFTNDANVFVAANPTSGASAALTNANWQLYVKASL